MPFGIQIDAERNCVMVTHHGDISVAESRAAQAAVFATLAEHGLPRVFIDVTGIRNDLSMIDLFVVTSDLDRPKLPQPRGALLARPDQGAKARFLETVAVNRGLNIRCFLDRGEALQWLSEE